MDSAQSNQVEAPNPVLSVTPSFQPQPQAESPEDMLFKAAGFREPGEERPRGADGKFLPTKQEAQQATQEAPKEATEAPKEEGESQEQAVEEPIYVADDDLKKKAKVKVQGEEVEVSLEEALQGYSRTADYTKKTQELAKERQALEAKVSQEREAERTEYVKQLNTLRAAVLQAAAPELANVNWSELAKTDQFRYIELSQKAKDVQEMLGKIEQEQKRVLDQHNKERQEALAKQVEESRAKVKEAIPDWTDDLYQRLLKRGVETYGFTQQEIGAVHDPRVIRLIHDAHQFRQMSESKPVVEKKVQDAPKVLKPGTPVRKDSGVDKLKTAQQNLKQTGSVEAFADFLDAHLQRR